MPQTRLIKKYANRRLYDTVSSSHVTLAGIRDLIIDGNDVKIVDDTTGDDITPTLLLQIIADTEHGGQPMLDTSFLTRIIRLYGGPMQELVGEFLRKSFDAFMTQQAQYQEQMRAAMAATPLATFQELAANNLKAWQDMQNAMLGKTTETDDNSE